MLENVFTSWKSTLSGLSGGIAGLLVLTNIIPIGTGVAALGVCQLLIGAFVNEKKGS